MSKKTTVRERLTEEEEKRMDKIRKILDVWESNKKIYAKAGKFIGLTEKMQTDAISRLRKLNTQPEKDWPNREQILSRIQVVPFVQFITSFYLNGENPAHKQSQDDMVQIKDLCGYAERKHIEILQEQNDPPFQFGHVKDVILQEGNNRVPLEVKLTMDQDKAQFELDWAKTARVHKKVVKAWEADHALEWQKYSIKEYFK